METKRKAVSHDYKNLKKEKTNDKSRINMARNLHQLKIKKNEKQSDKGTIEILLDT